MKIVKTVWLQDGVVERFVELCRYADEQCKAGQGDFSFRWIARRLSEEYGLPFTRNACIGKARRMGITKTEPPLTQPQKDARAARARAGQRGRKFRRPFRRRPLNGAAPIVIDPLEPDVPRISILDLTNRTCRWPYGDVKIEFCGSLDADNAAGRPYCPFHTRMSYRRFNAA